MKYLRYVLIPVALLLTHFSFGSDVMVHIDRHLYTVGDTMFGMLYLTEGCNSECAIDIFLVSNEAQTIGHQTIKISQNSGEFHYNIPFQLKSGIYSLQFTNHNESEVLSSVEIVIVNKANWQLLKDKASDTCQYSLPATPSNLNQNSSLLPLLDIPAEVNSGDSVSLEMKTLKNKLISYSISISDLSQDIEITDFCYEEVKSVSSGAKSDHPYRNHMILRGKTMVSGSNKISGNKRISLTIPGIPDGLFYTFSDSQGQFTFENLTFYGAKKIYLNSGSKDVDIAINNKPINIKQFSTVELNHPSLEKQIRQSILSAKVDSFYSRPPGLNSYTPAREENDILNGDVTVDLTDYINFKSMQELIKEAIPYFYFKNSHLRVFSKERRRTFTNSPLMLVNNVPVAEDSIILNLKQEYLQKAVVINSFEKLKLLGNVASNGVVAFYTLDPDFKYPEHVKEIIYEGFQNKKAHEVNWAPYAPYIPATLLWKTGRVGQEESDQLKFKAPDVSTRLKLSVKGIDQYGNRVFFNKYIEVRNK